MNIMKHHYFESLKQKLDEPSISQEKFDSIVGDTHFFLQILRVKLQSKDASMRNEAFQEIRELKQILEQRVSKFT